MKPTPQEIDEALACSEFRCSHHPQFDCDKHHPNPVLASAYRASQERIKIVKMAHAESFNELRSYKRRTESAEQSLSALRKENEGLKMILADALEHDDDAWKVDAKVALAPSQEKP